MKDVIVVAGCTHYDYLMAEYERQLNDAKFPYHFVAVDPMPDGPNSMTMKRKIDFVRSVASQFYDYGKVIISDAFDVLFYGTTDEVARRLPYSVMISGERNCYPEPNISPLFRASSPWRFANAGLMSGSPDFLLKWCEFSESFGELGILDQAWMNRRAADNSPLAMIDEATTMFYTVSSTQEDGKLQMHDGRPWNSLYRTNPCFFHFSGRCPVDGFRNFLVNGGGWDKLNLEKPYRKRALETYENLSGYPSFSVPFR